MATKKSGPKARAAVKRAKTSGARKAKATARPKRVAKKTKAAASSPSARRAAKPNRAALESAEIVALKARFQRERNGLEKSLSEAAREIGILRHYELRVTQLERQLQERDDIIARLRDQLADIERRPPEPVYEREVQHSFPLAAPGQDVDPFQDDEPLAEDGSLAEEEEA